MPIDKGVLAEAAYLARIRFNKLNEAVAPADATSVSKQPPGVLKMQPNMASAKVNSRLKQSQTKQSQLKQSSPPPSTLKKFIDVTDYRKQDAVSGTPITDTNNLSRSANLNSVTAIIKAAKAAKIDPYTALAIAHQESGIGSIYDEDAGEDTEGNPFRVRSDQFKGIPEEDMITNSMDILKEKFRIAKSRGKTDEASILQAWNGYGKVGKNTEGRQQKMYGIDVSKQDIDMDKNPVYGKRIIDVRENIIKKNPELVKLINSAQ